MTRTTKTGANAAPSTALPSGGPTENGARDSTKTVDHPTSSFDRRRHQISRKERVPSKIFVPINPNDVPKNPNRGKNLHTDPFAVDRPEREARRSRVKVSTPRGPQRSERPHTRTVKDPIKPAKDGFITANGVRHLSPKRVAKGVHGTTIAKAQPPKSFEGSRRFAQSPERKRAEVRTSASAAPSPAASKAPATARPSTAGATAISNVFPSDAPALMPPPAARAVGLKQTDDRHKYLTMEGVFCPMRGGKAPKPSSLAPWMQDQNGPHTGKGRGLLTARANATPYAIEA